MSISQKARSCTAMVAAPQIPISTSDVEALRDMASGMARPMITPPKDTAEAALPSLMRAISLKRDSVR